MNIDWINSFIVLAKTGNFVSACSELFITQQALSYHINQLEKKLNVKLIERGNKNNNLTFYGEEFLKKTINLIDNFETNIQEIKNNNQKNILNIIQVTEWNFDYSTSLSIVDFYNNKPNTVIKLYSAYFNDIESLMQDKNINIAFTTKKVKNKSKFSSHLINKIPYIIVSNKKNLKQWDKLTYLSPTYYSFTKNKDNLEKTHNLKIFADITSLNPSIELCKRGLGAMYITALSVEKEIREKDLVIIDSPIEKKYQEIFFIKRNNYDLSGDESLFIEIISKNIEKSLKVLHNFVHFKK